MMKVGIIGMGRWGNIMKGYLEKRFEISDFDSADAVLIATPNDTHYELTKMALEHHKHVMCEKPLAFTVDECETLKEIAKLYNLKLTVNYVLTFSPSIKKFNKEFININYPTANHYIHMINITPATPEDDNQYWRLGSHMLSVLDMITPLNEIKFEVTNNMIDFSNDKNLTGRIVMGFGWWARISSIYLKRNDFPIISWTTGKDDLRYSVDHFYNVINGTEESNIDRAIRVTKVLEDLGV